MYFEEKYQKCIIILRYHKKRNNKQTFYNFAAKKLMEDLTKKSCVGLLLLRIAYIMPTFMFPLPTYFYFRFVVQLVGPKFQIQYAHHYKQRLLYFLPHVSLWFIINSGYLILETIYVVNKEILQKKSAVYNQEQFQIKGGLYWHVYGILICTLQSLNFQMKIFGKINLKINTI